MRIGRRGICPNVGRVDAAEKRSDVGVGHRGVREQQPPVVGPTVHLGLQHPEHRADVLDRQGPGEFHETCDTAHGWWLRSTKTRPEQRVKRESHQEPSLRKGAQTPWILRTEPANLWRVCHKWATQRFSGSNKKWSI